MPGLHTTPPDVHTAPAPTSSRDRNGLEREPGAREERVLAQVQRRGAGVRGLPDELDMVALDADRPEHDADRALHRLSTGPCSMCSSR